ncbi:MAG: hypothetical protein ACOYZ7_17705 [Chloroflexota bacterium]
MSTVALPDSWPELVQQWQAAMAYVAEKTCSLPLSQVVSSPVNWLDLWLDPALSPAMREEQLFDLQQRFVRRWEVVAMHMMSGETARISQQVLLNPSLDITQGRKPFGKDLAHAFWSAVVALQNDAPTVEAPGLLPQRDELRAHVRLMATRRGRLYLPVISYAPLIEIEWQVLLAEVPKMVDVTLAIEGVSIFWLLGTFVRDVSGRIILQPELGYGRPGPGTRIKLLRLILGTEYHKHGDWLGRLAAAVEGHQRGGHDDLLAEIPLHPVTVQIFPGEGDYKPYNPDVLVSVEREVSDRVFRAEREPRRRPAIVVDEELPEPPPPPPPPAPEPALSSPPMPAGSPTTEDLRLDADWLRQKGQLALESNKALAKKYLLASTLLDNSSVDVWMMLAQLASNEREKQTFLREAEKVLSRG